MAKYQLPYKTTNTLSSYLLMRKAEMQAEKGGLKVYIKEVEEDLARHCNITRETISLIKRGVNQPSLPLAMKICEYFQTPVEQMFTLIDQQDSS